MTPGESVSGLAAATLDLLPQSVYIVDREMTVIAWNARREQGPLGLARVRALGRNLREVLSPRGFASVLPAFRHVLETGTPYEERRTSRDGRRTYRVRRMPITGTDGVTHVVTVSDEVPHAVLPEMPAVIAPGRGHRVVPLIPVCAWCKKIRDQHGEWHQVEAYLATRSDATFTHGICQDCSGRAHLAAGHDTALAPLPSARPRRPTAP